MANDVNSGAVALNRPFDVDATLEAVARQRFAMPPAVVAAFKQAAAKGAARLLSIVNSPNFEKLPVRDQVRLLELIFDRAYGKAETASSSAMTDHKTGHGAPAAHSKELDLIEQRMKARRKTFPEFSRTAERGSENRSERGSENNPDRQKRDRAVTASRSAAEEVLDPETIEDALPRVKEGVVVRLRA